MRARNIKPGFFVNEDLAKLPPLTRILFAGLWCLADRAGIIEDRPNRIKAEVLPYDKCDIDKMLNELDEAGFIKRYVVPGENGTSEQLCVCIVKWFDHQNPHPNEKESKFVSYSEALAKCHDPLVKRLSPLYILNPESGIRNPESNTNEGGMKLHDNPQRPQIRLTDVQRTVLAFKIASGHDLNDKAWDKAFFPRYSKPAKELLEYLGSWQEAADCVSWVIEKMKSKNLTFTFETVIKFMADYKLEVMEKKK